MGVEVLRLALLQEEGQDKFLTIGRRHRRRTPLCSDTHMVIAMDVTIGANGVVQMVVKLVVVGLLTYMFEVRVSRALLLLELECIVTGADVVFVL